MTSSSSSTSLLLSAEQKNAAMNAERTFLTRTFQAALDGDFETLRTQVESYQHDHGSSSSSSSAAPALLSFVDILSQFRDGNKRTALHFACQSVTNQQKQNPDDKKKKDIVPEILDWLLLSSSSSSQPSTDSSNTSSSSSIPALLRLKDREGLTPLMLAARVAADDPATAECRVLAILLADAKSQQQQQQQQNTTATTTSTATATSTKQEVPWPKLGLQRSKVAGATALHYAAGANATATTIQALMRVSGMAALMAFSKRGGTPLHWAACAVATAASRNDDSNVATTTTAKNTDSSNTTIAALVNAMEKAVAATDNEDSSDDLSTRRRIALGNFIHASQLPSSSSDVMMIPPALHLACAAMNQDHAIFLLQTCVKKNISLAPTIGFLLPPYQNSVLIMAADLNLLRLVDLLCNNHNHDENDNVHAALQQEPAPTTSTESSGSLWDWLRDYQNAQGLTALQVAAREGHVGCVWILMGGSQNHTENDARLYMETFQKEHAQQQKQNDSQSNNKTTMLREQNDADSSSPPSPPQVTGSSSSASQEEEQAAKAEAARLLQLPKTGSPEKAQAFKLQGNAHFAAQAWQEAIDAYSVAIQEDPTNAALYSNRSAACHHLDLAASSTTKATYANKGDGDGDSNEKGSTTRKKETVSATTVAQQEALSDAWLCRALRPDWPKASFRLATALSAVGRFEDAAVAAWEGLQQDSDNEELKKLLQDNVKMGREQHLLQHKNAKSYFPDFDNDKDED
jgi:tetratricopeptide (TPR) repeat protein